MDRLRRNLLVLTKSGLILLVFVLFLSACDNESIVVPTSDNTPPTIIMAVDFTTSEGRRQTIELTEDSADVSFDLDPSEPIAALATARDTDGGVMGIMMVHHVSDICEGDQLGNDIGSGIAEIPNTGSPGDTASTVEVASYTYNPLDSCPLGNSNSEGFIAAYAENFHDGSAETASFNFEYK